MALSVLNNIASLAAQNQLTITNSNLQKSLFQLSSGSRINSGADDAAGLAIADGLHANITALTQSARNANDGVGELQVADGSLAQVTTLLNRSITLATEAATGTVSDPQRVSLNAEYTAIKAEIDRIGSKTNYNGGQVFTANTLNVFLSDAGATSNSLIGVTTGLLSANSLNISQTPATATLTAASTPATDVITPSANPLAGDSITVGGQTYDIVAAIAAPAAGHIQILKGAALTNTLDNLAAAINGTSSPGNYAYGAGAGANTQVTAANTGGTALTVTAIATGTSGNGITASAVASGATTYGIATPTTTGGQDVNGVAQANDTVTVGNQTYTFVASLSGTPAANSVLLGANETASLANLAAAVNGASGAGVTYSSNTSKNASATATAGQNSIVFTATTPGVSGNSLASVSSVATDNTFGGGTFSGGAVTNDLLTQGDATAALATINNAIQTVAALRGSIGATVNRLQSAAGVISNQVQNLTGAEDGVRAADIPSTVATLAKYSILEQTGISALAQANQQQQLVLKLLQ
jgi:flagellin